METQTLKYLITFEAQDASKVIQAIQQVKTNTDSLDVSLRKMGASSSATGINLGGLVTRALVTIPVWMALRSAFSGTIKFIDDSADSIVKLDKALRQAQNEIQGTTDLLNVMNKLKDSAVSLSKETGVGPEKIVDTFKRLASSGLTVQESLAGMEVAVKGSIANNEDLGETTGFLTDTYKLYHDRITQVTGAQAKFNYIMGTVAALMPNNTFTLKEFIGAATNFLPVAKNLNLTLDETFTLIATAATGGQRGPKAGTQISSALSKMQEATAGKQISDFLRGPDGKDPTAGLTSFQILVEVLKKIAKEGDNAAEKVNKIFGLKGTKFIFTEAADMDAFIKQFAELQKMLPSDRNAAEALRLATAMKSIAEQSARIKQGFNDIGRNFLTGLFGDAPEVAKLLKNVADGIDGIGGAAKAAGIAVRDLASAVGTVAALGGIIGIIGRAGAAGSAIVAANASRGLLGAQLGLGAAGFARPAAGAIAAGGATALGAGAAGVFANNFMTDSAIELDKTAEAANQRAMEDFMRTNDINRKKRGLKPVRPDLASDTTTLAPIVVTAPKMSEFDKALNDELNNDDRISIMQKRMESIGFNAIEIQKAKILGLEKEADIYKGLVDLAIMENEEIAQASKQLQTAFSGGLSDLIMGKSNFQDFGKKIGDTMRQGIADAFADNITEQIFKSTGIGDAFGGLLGNIRHANDGIGGPIKDGFDYGAKASYNAIVRGFKDGASGGGGVGTASFGAGGINFGGFGGVGGGIGGTNPFGGALTLPGFGAGGLFGPKYGVSGGLIGPARAGQAGAGFGAGAGALGGSALLGFSAYQAAGGSQGSLSVPAGIAGSLGGLAVAGSLGLFGGAGAALGAATGLSALAPLLGPIGIALLAGSFLFSAFSKTKSTSVSSQTSTESIGPKIDVSNTKLELINRNLVAIKSSLQQYILPGSAYFSEATNLSDEFSIAARR